ncbi:cyclic nucleotide gated channel 1 [Prunus dulcis]|uniref:Cyclic nucleotide gated channel 1 n=1 Tax=Prunus dulcis TaxID=3755 RepID=A0A4Y1RS18_PRUDU|nr:cyclic nucleotide gated channel 1 [Prunus dulcis]
MQKSCQLAELEQEAAVRDGAESSTSISVTPSFTTIRCATLNLDEAFWELTGFGVLGTPKLSEWEAGAIPGWVTTLGSCFVSSQEQNRAGW